MPQPFPAQLGVDAWRAVDPPASGEELSGISCAAGRLNRSGHGCGEALAEQDGEL
jgi:hypothetical protein